MVAAAERDCELVADFNAQGSLLCKTQVVWIRRMTTADKTRLGRHKTQMRFISATFGFG